MFLERTASRTQRKGWIEVICGSMFSGKTEELIRRLRRAEFAKQKVEIFKPGVDTRYDETNAVSHEGTTIRSTPVPSRSNLLLLAGDIEVVGIDEAQFFDDGLPAVCVQLRPEPAMCGANTAAAMAYLQDLERQTAPT